eukprot:584678-Amphidinium_carterae.2
MLQQLCNWHSFQHLLTTSAWQATFLALASETPQRSPVPQVDHEPPPHCNSRHPLYPGNSALAAPEHNVGV